MQFSALKQELSDRGFSMMSDTRLGYLINRAAQQVDMSYLWPYREAAVTGTAPVTVTDLGRVQAVLDTTHNAVLEQADWTDLLAMFGEDLSTTGSPWYWYVAWPAGVPEVATYPVSTATIGVQYWKVTADMSAASDTPASPARFHMLLVDIAERLASREVGRPENVTVTQSEIDRAIGLMATELLSDQGSRFAQTVASTDA